MSTLKTKYRIEVSPSHGDGCEFVELVKASSVVDAFKQAKAIVKQLNEMNDKDCEFDVFAIGPCCSSSANAS